MDWNEMGNAYRRAQESLDRNQYLYTYGERQSRGGNYSKTAYFAPKVHDDYIVVYSDSQAMVCRSRNGRMFEYDIIAYFPTAHEAVNVAKVLNEKEGQK